MKARKLFTYLVLTCFVSLFFALDSGADVVVKGVKEPPSPTDLTKWQGIQQERRTWAEDFENYGITLEVEDIQQIQLDDLPGLVNIKSGFTDDRLPYITVELGLRKSATTVSFSGTFTKGPDSSELSGDVVLALKGTGVTTKGTWTTERGLELEGGIVWEYALYTAGVQIDSGGKRHPRIGFKVGPARLKIDPVKFFKRQAYFYRSVTPKIVEKAKEKIDDVGGVLIQFDLGLMALALTDRPPADVEKLGDVSLVSLKRVLAARKASEMTDLGEVTSVHGFLLDEINSDIILIGKSEPWAPRIGVDVLVAVLRSVWRDGLTPFVSIDPDPSDKAAPHRARFGGVSAGLEESSLVKIMFKADYLLKRFDLGEPGMTVPGVKSYHDLLVEDLKGGRPVFSSATVKAIATRLWLSPRQPGAGDIWELKSEEGALYMFRSEVQVLSEVEHIIRVRRSVSYKEEKVANKADPLSDMACLGYTRNYDKLERRHSEFKQLRQVFELVQFAEILRMKKVRYAILGELSRLPISPEPHRDFFEAVGPKQVGESKWDLSGGVVAELRVSRSKLRAVRELESILERLRSIVWRGPVVRIEGLFLPVVRETRVLNRVLIAEAFIEEALNELSDGNLQAALSKASKAVDADPESAEAYFLRAFVHDESGEYQNAVKDWDNAIKYDPQDPLAYYNRGIDREELGDHEGAIEDFSRVLKINPRDAITYYNRGTPKYALGEYRGAIEDYTAALKINPAYAKAYSNRGLAKDASGDHEGAIEDFSRALKINPRDAIAYYNRGAPKYALGNYEGAIADYTAALKIDPRSDKAYHNRGVAKNALGDYEGAIQDYTAALAIDPQRAQTYYNRGLTKNELRDYKGAIQDFTAVLEIDPGDADAHANLEWAKNVLRNLEETTQDIMAAPELDSRDATAFYERGLLKYELADHKGAIEDFTAALKMNSRYAEAYYSRGLARYELGDYEGAIEDYTAALKINPRNVEAYYNRALAKEALGDDEGALDDHEAAMEIMEIEKAM